MAGNPEYQSLDPSGAPDPVTPADSPSDAAGYAMVTPSGRGPAPYDIQADNGEASITSSFDDANAVAGAAIESFQAAGPRQAATAGLLYSPQGFSSGGGNTGYDIPQGTAFGWPADVQPGGNLETPVQGEPDYPADSTMQPGVPMYGC